MIIHRPLGTGHPFAIEIDQRYPVIPLEGRRITLGVSTVGEPSQMNLEYRLNQGSSVEVGLEARKIRSGSINSSGGHLSEAQANSVRASDGFATEIGPFELGSSISYRFTSGPERTKWFETTVYGWREPSLLSELTNGQAVKPISVLTDGVNVKKVRYQIPLAPGEKVCGFGERFEATEFSNRHVVSVLFEQYKNQGAEERTYLPMNFAHVVGGRGWGFWINTYRRVEYSINLQNSGFIEAECEVDFNEENPHRVPEVHLFAGDPKSVLRQFLTQVGEPTELPEWVFGLWASSNEWNTQQEVERQAGLHKEHDIPISNLVIEAWSDEATFTMWRDSKIVCPDVKPAYQLSDFEFSADGAWPDPKGMIDNLHAQAIKLHLWQIPLLKMDAPPTAALENDIEQAIKQSRLILEPDEDSGLRPYRNRGWWFPTAYMPDLTDSATAKWWAEKRRYLVKELGVDGFKTDGGEHAWGDELVYLDGSSGADKNWRFPVDYAKTFGDLLRSEGKAPVTFSRAGNVGSQAHGAFWAGDENSTWEAFRWSLNAGLNAASCGLFYWGWDIAGFSGEVPTAELYLRSAAAACFVPIMQYHSEFNDHRIPNRDRTPWNIAERHNDAKVIGDFRKIVRLRESLRSYMADNMRQGLNAGLPLMRPLFFDFDDAAIWETSYQWMFGMDLLVAPVVEEGATGREVYLPNGSDWVECLSGKRHEGGQSLEVAAERHQPIVFAKTRAWSQLQSLSWNQVAV